MFRGRVWEIKVFKQTRYCSTTQFEAETKELIENTYVYKTPKNLKVTRVSPKSNITFVYGGSASTAYKYAEDPNKHIAVLNFADAIIPGGCVEYGAPTQEENLCRCTNLYESIVNANEYYYINSLVKDKVYSDALIYSPGCVCFRDDLAYTKLKPRKFDIITCPSPAKKVKHDVFINRIEGIIKAAVYNNVDTIILGAWGCGAFGQDPYVMGQCFAKVLNKYNHFKEVVFAIRPSEKGWAEDNNTLFEEGFKSEYDG